MKNTIKFISCFLLAIFLTSCETGELEIVQDPSELTPESADINFTLNDIQLSFNSVWGGINGPTRRITRMVNQFGSYNGVVDEGTLNGTTGEWATAYQMFSNIDILQGLIDNQEVEFPYHLGITQVLEAYTYLLLVDTVGDIPFSEANQPSDIPNPNVDGGLSVYNAQLDLLDQAISNFQEESAIIPNDLFYITFDANKWIALANTLKLKAYLNLRLTDEARARDGINQVLGSSNIIDTEDEDFQFPYGSNISAPDTRHPIFTSNYLTDGANIYMSNYLYDLMNVGDDSGIFIETGEVDPRARYYFYRQRNQAPSGNNLPCEGNPQYEYCFVGNFYWGRDHGDGEGIPGDNTRRTTYGIYPIGGAFDRNLFAQARANNETLGGAGIRPIYLSSFTHFLLAEAQLTMGTSGNAASLLEQGIRLSMDKVIDFANVNTIDDDDPTVDLAATSQDVDAYVARILAEYNDPTNSEEDRLEIIAREAFIASWGNGIEPYNTYRRTGRPNLQTPVSAAGTYPRSFRYPADEVVGNPNITQKALTEQVFWDNNAANFID